MPANSAIGRVNTAIVCDRRGEEGNGEEVEDAHGIYKAGAARPGDENQVK